jgi:hypothetical protein
MPEKPRKTEDGLTLERISRRRMLKRIGAGAAVAWSAPILTSLSTPAFADQYCTQCAGDFCFGQTVCGTDPPLGCPCAQPVGSEGGAVCFCYHDDFCVSRTPCPGGQGDCPAGETCVHTCCDAFIGSPVCFPPCATDLAPSSTSSGQTGYNW